VPAHLRMFEDGAGDWRGHLLVRSAEECADAVGSGMLKPDEGALAHDLLCRAFDKCALDTPVILHGDLQARHVLLDDSGTAILVDFGDAGWGDAAWDLTVLSHWHPAHLSHILDGYRADAELRRRVNRYWTAYSLLRHLRVARWYQENDFGPERSLEQVRRRLVGLRDSLSRFAATGAGE